MNSRPLDAPHAMLEAATAAELAREMFCRSLTNYLETDVRPRLRNVYEQHVAPTLGAALGREPGRREIARVMRGIAANRAWYALRTDAQRMAYGASAAVIDRQRAALIARANSGRDQCGTLELDPELPIPRYVSAHDIHHMPGSYHRELVPDDITAGALFDRQMTVNRMGSQGALNDDPGVSIAAYLRQRFPDFKPKRILELGCTVAHNLLPFKLAYPDAEVHGIDVSAPCLRYAHARAGALGVEVHLSQQNAESTRFAAGSFDLVFSRILMHETSELAAPRIFAECHRILARGGLTFHSDAPQFDELDPYTASLRDWDTHFNNEPFMERYYDLPVERMLEKAGFARERMFRDYAPSEYIASHKVDPRLNRSGGRYFLIGAWAAA
jgi:SAM-dependent methyltransferase